MAFVSKLVAFVAANFPLLAVIGLIVIFIVILAKLLGGSKVGPNPFLHDSTRPVEPLVTDLSKRDKVLKQGKLKSSLQQTLKKHRRLKREQDVHSEQSVKLNQLIQKSQAKSVNTVLMHDNHMLQNMQNDKTKERTGRLFSSVTALSQCWSS